MLLWGFVAIVVGFFIVLPIGIQINKLWNIELKKPDPNERDWMEDFNRRMLGIPKN
jgi:hypothetical protein